LPSLAFFKFDFGFSPYDTTRKVCGLAEQHNAISPFSRVCVVVVVREFVDVVYVDFGSP
jgi:hypothetical protein